MAQPPTELGKSLRCCVPCRLIKTFEQFYEQARESIFSVTADDTSSQQTGNPTRSSSGAATAAAASTARITAFLLCDAGL